MPHFRPLCSIVWNWTQGYCFAHIRIDKETSKVMTGATAGGCGGIDGVNNPR